MARRKLTGFAAALESAAKHSKTYAQKAFARRSAASKKGWVTRRRPISIPEVAEAQGLQKAVDTARELRIHPDAWARDLADEFDLDSPTELYDDYFGYSADGAW